MTAMSFLILGFTLFAFAQRHPETFSEMTPEINKVMIINVDVMTQYNMTLKFIHAGESMRAAPIAVWKKITEGKRKTLNELAEESARKTDAHFAEKCRQNPELYYCKFPGARP